MSHSLDQPDEDQAAWDSTTIKLGRALFWAVLFIVAGVVLAMLHGCQQVAKPSDPNPALGATERAMVRGDEALKIINDMADSASGITRAGLGWVSGILINQHQDLKDGSAAQILADAAWRKTFDEQNEKFKKTSEQLAVTQKDLKDQLDSFFSHRQKVLAAWLISISALIFIVYEILNKQFAGGSLFMKLVGWIAGIFKR